MPTHASDGPVAELADLQWRLRAWTHSRQQLDRAAASPLEALRKVIAVYSSHPTAPLALLARSAGLDEAQFSALEQDRQAVRIPAMRQSIFLVPAETAPRMFAATRQPLEKLEPRLRYAGLDWDQYALLKAQVLELAREPLSASALQKALKWDQDATAEVRIMTAVRMMTHEGLVLRVGSSLRGDSLRYVATSAWLGQPLAEEDPVAALQWLGAEYLRAFGPARIEDFAWWSGVSRRRAAEALAAAEAVDIGPGLLLPADQQSDFARIEPVDPETIDLLPKWDAYTMGYAPDGRQRLVDDQHLGLAYSSGGGGMLAGDGLPLLLRGGGAVASWSHRFKGQHMHVQVQPFTPDALPHSHYEHSFNEIGELLNAAAVEVLEHVKNEERERKKAEQERKYGHREKRKEKGKRK